MRTRRIGDVPVSAIGLGGMPMSIEGRPDERGEGAVVARWPRVTLDLDLVVLSYPAPTMRR